MSNMGTFLLSHELLVQALHLPDNTKILGVLDHDRRTCRVMITNPDLPAGGRVTELLPHFHTTYHEPQEFEQIAETRLESWGIEKPE